jgi:hypothetical protein
MDHPLFHDFVALPFVRRPSQSLPSTCRAGNLAHLASVEIPIFFTTMGSTKFVIHQ